MKPKLDSKTGHAPPTQPGASSVGAKEAKPGDTAVDLTTKGNSSSPAMPHERDEGGHMTDDIPSKEVQQAHRDLERGLQDTSRAPESDSAYRKLKK